VVESNQWASATTSGSSTASPEGARPNAVGLAARILEEWEDLVGIVELVPGANGIFDVHVNGDLVFTKSMLGRYPQPGEVLPLLPERLSAA